MKKCGYGTSTCSDGHALEGLADTVSDAVVKSDTEHTRAAKYLDFVQISVFGQIC